MKKMIDKEEFDEKRFWGEEEDKKKIKDMPFQFQFQFSCIVGSYAFWIGFCFTAGQYLFYLFFDF